MTSDERAEIDRLDAELDALLAKRTALSAAIQRRKGAEGLPPFDATREALLIARSAYPEVTAEVLRGAKAKAEAARELPERSEAKGLLGGVFTVIAGPCSAENPEQLEETGAILWALGVRDLRAGAWKPRTTRSAFQGHGARALAWMRAVCDRYSLRLWTEIRDVANIEEARGIVDVAWIGARNGQNFELLTEVGKTFPRVVLKRGAGMTVEEWVSAADYIRAGGATVALCERGVRSFDRSFRNMLDLAGAVWAKRLSGLEVLVDVSHSTGLPALAAPLARAARAAGLDGVLVEAHPRPRESVTDADQALSFGELRELIEGVSR